MILHLIADEKFTYDYIQRINRLFNIDEHYFLIATDEELVICDRSILQFNNVSIYHKNQDMASLKKRCIDADRIILHSLFLGTREMILIHQLQRKYNLKIIWVIWGGDLYDVYRYNHSLLAIIRIKPLINEICRKFIIKNMYMVVTGCDYEHLLQKYKTNAILRSALYTYEFIQMQEVQRQDDKINVMVGHSATATCCHIDTFNMLKQYVGKIRVFSPLSYPKDMEYISLVEREGRKIFGEDFVSLKDFMSYDEYVKFLNGMDIGIFNNNRQQGMGNITNLLYLGKKVYLSKDNTIGKIYHQPEYTIYASEEIGRKNFLDALSLDDMKKNRDNILYKFSDDNFIKEWKQVFED